MTKILHVKTIIIISREADLMYDEKLDPVMRKMEVARLIASKIVYQWFNNILSSSWSHLWIYDAFANIFGEEAVAKVFIFLNHNMKGISLLCISFLYLRIRFNIKFNSVLNLHIIGSMLQNTFK